MYATACDSLSGEVSRAVTAQPPPLMNFTGAVQAQAREEKAKAEKAAAEAATASPSRLAQHPFLHGRKTPGGLLAKILLFCGFW